MKQPSKADGAKARLHFVSGRAGVWVDPEDIELPTDGSYFMEIGADGVCQLKPCVLYVAFIEYATKEEFEKIQADEKEKAKLKEAKGGTDA